MPRFRIGVLADAFRLPVRDALAKARDLGVDGLQLYAVGGEMAPEALGPGDRRDLRVRAERLGLAFSALCGDLGGHGFERPEDHPEKIRRSKAIVDLARDLGAPVVTTHIGVVPPDPGHPRRAVLRGACRRLGDYAREKGIRFAIETGPETAAVLASFLDEVDSPGIGVNLDPANLAMVTADDPVAAVPTLAQYIVHTHAKDGVNHRPCDPEAVYGAFAEGTFGEWARNTGGAPFDEVPLGEGAVDWPAYLDALAAAGYDGFLAIERECGADPAGDIARAVDFLKALV